jgi:hypothetical protein
MKEIPEEILALPLPEGHEWRIDENVMGAYNIQRNWWCWFWYHERDKGDIKKHAVQYDDPKQHEQKHFCYAKTPYEAAQIIMSKMMLGMYE